MSEDKKAIWTDCPQCARKHLLAAYAWLTQDTGTEISVTACGLLLARAEILLDEALTGGYLGNAALASGCLAAVEGVAHTNFVPAVRRQLRQLRLDIDAMKLQEAMADLADFLPTDMSGRHIAAHLTEARREFPEMEDVNGMGQFDGGYHHTNCSELRDWIIKAVRQLEETYELGAGSGDPTPPNLNVSAEINAANAKLMDVANKWVREGSLRVPARFPTPPTLRKKKGKANV